MNARTIDIKALTWPLTRLGEGLEELARRGGLSPAMGEALAVPEPVVCAPSVELHRWIDWAARQLGVEAEAVEIPLAEFEIAARAAGPALFRLNLDDGPAFMLVLKSALGQLQVLAPDLHCRRCPVDVLRNAVCRELEAPLVREIDELLAMAVLPEPERPRVRAAMLRERLGTRPLDGCWILRLAPTAPFWQQLVHARLPHRIGWMLAVFALVYGFEIAGWGLIGNAALNGRFDLGWMAAWILLMLSLVPLMALGGWLNSTFGLDAGRIFKKRLLAGALRMNLDLVKQDGAGRLLSRVMESQALESMAVNGGLGVLVALLELAFAAWVLSIGAGGLLHVLLMVAWLVISLGLIRRYIGYMRAWVLLRLDITHGLIEQMVGHRARLAQEWPQRRDEQEDQMMRHYLQVSANMDRAALAVTAGIPGGWGVIGVLGLVPGFVTGTASPAGMAIAFGGLLLAHRAFGGISGGVSALAGALIAWQQVGPLFRSGAGETIREPFMPSAALAGGSAGDSTDEPVLIDASQLVYRYQPQGDPVLDGVDLSVRRGEKLLLEGPSGGGKSTLASVLVGLRQADSGLLLLGGMDRYTIGDNWHRMATEAPQFHENHILSGTLGFNLLMGRNWPASREDLEEAEALCRDLGLGDLLERMPAGLNQMVGETGWQLSHGECSRIFLARTLLQDSQFIIMDESFAALDPQTLDLCLHTVFRRARTLMVIAHP